MKDVKRNQEAVDEIKAILLREHGTKDFDVFSRVANLRRNEQNNKMYDMTFMICGIISLLVGGIVVMNIQLASFNERVREVGTRKAVGASPAQIFFQFLSETVLVSVFGGFLGIFVGKFFSRRHRRADARSRRDHRRHRGLGHRLRRRHGTGVRHVPGHPRVAAESDRSVEGGVSG